MRKILIAGTGKRLMRQTYGFSIASRVKELAARHISLAALAYHRAGQKVRFLLGLLFSLNKEAIGA